MQQKNKTKTLVSLVIIAIFVTALMAGSSSNSKLIAPVSAAVPLGLPASSYANPTIVSAVPFTLTVSPVVGATGYQFQIFTTDIKGLPSAAPLVTRTSTTTNYQVVATDKLQTGIVYAWKARGTAGLRLGIFSQWFYFKITLPVSASSVPSIFATGTLGTYKFNLVTNVWDLVTKPSTPGPDIFTQTPTGNYKYNQTTNVWEKAPSAGPDFFASTADGKVYKFNGTDWVSQVVSKTPVPTPTTAVGRAIDTVTNAISTALTAIGNFASNLVSGIVNFFTGSRSTVVPVGGVFNREGISQNPGTTEKCASYCLVAYSSGSQYYGYYYCKGNCGTF